MQQAFKICAFNKTRNRQKESSHSLCAEKHPLAAILDDCNRLFYVVVDVSDEEMISCLKPQLSKVKL